MKRKLAGTIYGAVASMSYGTNPLFALPLFFAGIGVNSVLFYRYFFACILYFLWLKLVKRISLKISLREFLHLFVLALFFSFSSLTLFVAFKYIDAGIACTILFIYPVIVALIMRIFYKEKLTRTTILAILLTSMGILLLYNGADGAALNVKGVIIVLLSALLYAFYIVFVKKDKVLMHIKSEKVSFYVILFGLSVYILNLKFCTELQILTTPFQWILALSLAIFPTIVSIETITIAIKLIGSTITAVLGALEPLTAVFFGVVFFNEQLTLRIIAGIASVLAGVLLIVVKKLK